VIVGVVPSAQSTLVPALLQRYEDQRVTHLRYRFMLRCHASSHLHYVNDRRANRIVPESKCDG
jgi:hypothetical protein